MSLPLVFIFADKICCVESEPSAKSGWMDVCVSEAVLRS